MFFLFYWRDIFIFCHKKIILDYIIYLPYKFFNRLLFNSLRENFLDWVYFVEVFTKANFSETLQFKNLCFIQFPQIIPSFPHFIPLSLLIKSYLLLKFLQFIFHLKQLLFLLISNYISQYIYIFNSLLIFALATYFFNSRFLIKPSSSPSSYFFFQTLNISYSSSILTIFLFIFPVFFAFLFFSVLLLASCYLFAWDLWPIKSLCYLAFLTVNEWSFVKVIEVWLRVEARFLRLAILGVVVSLTLGDCISLAIY